MHYADFAARYPRERGQAWLAEASRSGETRESVRWSHVLGVWLHDHLSGVGDRRSALDHAAEFARYTQWRSSPAAGVVRTRSVLPGGEDGARAVRFHVLSDALLPAWRWLHAVGPLPVPDDGRRSQVQLALHAAAVIRQRRAGDAAVHDGPGTLARRRQDDALSAVDTALALVEIVRVRPTAVVVPAPPQFRTGPPGSAVDLLVLDSDSRTVNGIRVETGMTRSQRAREYRREGVELIDGAADLANERLVPLRPGSATKVLAAWPGLVSGHFLLRADARRALYAPWRSRIEQWQGLLADELHGTADPLARAVVRLRDRVLAPLGSMPPAVP